MADRSVSWRACSVGGCGRRSMRYGTITVNGFREFRNLCWQHYRSLVLGEDRVKEMDSRPRRPTEE